MSLEIIETRDLLGKPGIKIRREIYDEVESFITSQIRELEEVTLSTLLTNSSIKLNEHDDLAFIIYSVKTDMEARRIIQVVVDAHTKQLKYKLKAKKNSRLYKKVS